MTKTQPCETECEIQGEALHHHAESLRGRVRHHRDQKCVKRGYGHLLVPPINPGTRACLCVCLSEEGGVYTSNMRVNA
jgi:hypothetical protein